MRAVSLYIIVMLGIINMQLLHAKRPADLKKKNLIDDFLNHFNKAVVKQTVQDESKNTIVEYSVPFRGSIDTPLPQELLGTTYRVGVAKNTFAGVLVQISISENNRTACIGNNDNKIDLNVPITSLSESLLFDAIILRASVSPGPAGYKLNDMRILFVPYTSDGINYPEEVSETDIKLANQIKAWLDTKLHVVVEKYEEFIARLTDAGLLFYIERFL